MSELRLHKLVCQIVCTEHDDDGDVIGERVVGEGTFFPSQLATIEEQMRVAIDQANGPRRRPEPMATFDGRAAPPLPTG